MAKMLHTGERQSYKLWGRQSGLHNIRLQRRQRTHGNAGPGWTEGLREAGGVGNHKVIVGLEYT